ncbi:MAG TPA: CARDB domain-containing protein [Bacteroidales bacterium]|nr:CARDB domain-containing protein [Bacteroidales bacterium]
MKIIRTDKPAITTGSRIFHKTIMNLSVSLVVFILVLMKPVFAQTPMLTADTVIAHQGDSIDIAVRAHDLPKIGSITLYIQFNSTTLSYGRALNIHSLLIPGYPLINKLNSNTIAVSWFDIDGVTIGTGKILDLRFKYNSGASPVTFLTSCEITDTAGNILSPGVVYRGGLVSPSVSVNITSNKDGICMGDSVLLTAQASGGQGGYTFNWSSDPVGFSATLSAVWVKPTVNTVYSVKVSDGIDSAFASKAITVYSNTPPSAVTSMLPADSSFDISYPILFSWSPSANASLYDLYIWKYNVSQPTTPTVSNITQINYQLTGSSLFTYGDTCKWRIVAKNPCAQTPGPIQVFSITGLPELHVTGITNSQPIAGQPMTISWTVQNDGNWPTPSGNIWMDRVWLSPDIEVRIGEAEDILLGQYPNVSYLDPGENYVQTQQIQIPANLIGSYYLFVITDAMDALFMNWPQTGPPLPYNPPPYYRAYTHGGSYVNVVKEISDQPPYHDNFFYKEVIFPIPPEPDLKVTSIITPADMFSGQTVTISWTVKNYGDGNTNTSNWSDRVYISSDTALNINTAVNLGTFTHTGLLNPDSSYTTTHAVTIPSNIYGTYYFYVITDVANNVFEYVYENNNTTRSDSVIVYLTPPADLVVTHINMPDTISNQDVFMVGWTVQNQGATPPTVFNWTDGVYLSDLPYFDIGQALNLGPKSISVSSLPPDSTYSATKQINFSQNLTGPYYVYVKTDLNNNVFEFEYENNNVLRTDNPVMIVNPDLIISNMVCPLVNNTSLPFNLQWSVLNNGHGKILNKTWKDRIMISKSPVYHPDSMILVTEQSYTSTSLLPGESLNRTKSISLPDNLSGAYYLYIYSDWNNNIYENGNENNNLLRSTDSIWLAKPDLAVSTILIPPADSGTQAIDIKWSIKNVGTGIVYNRNWTDRILMTHSPVYDPDSVFQIASLNYDAYIDPGDSIIKQVFVTLPDSAVPGTYYIFIHADYLDQIFENYSEANNLEHSASTIQIKRPDLIVSSLVVPSSANSGETINVQWVTENTGTLTMWNKTWKDRIYLSHFPSYYQGGNVFLGEKVCNGTLHPGDTMPNQLSVEIPEGLQGNYYVHVYTDYGDGIDEAINENNNIADFMIHLNIGTWADLQVMNIQIPDSAEAGNNIPLNFIVKNAGAKNITGKTWIDKVFISSIPIWDPGSSSHLRSLAASFSVAADSTYSIVSDINLPAGLAGGNHYIYVFADAEDSIFEYTAEYNNVLRSNALYIQPLPPVDLVALDIVNPDTVNSGQAVTVQWTVKNLSVTGSVITWYDAVYLSTDSIWNQNTDLYLGKRNHHGILDFDESYSCSQSFNIPNGISGNYYLLVVADYEQDNNDGNLLNNSGARKKNGPSMLTTHITLTPPPDLVVTSFSVPTQAVTGVSFNAIWTVKNQGVGSISGSTWTDKIYLSSDFVINTGDVMIGSKTRTGIIGINETYSDTLPVTLPNNVTGNFIIIIMTDGGNGIFESDENNNTKYAFTVISQPPPADLFVVEIVPPDSVTVGKTTTIQWTLKNIGQNPAIGTVKDMVYFSEDPFWDIDDELFGSYQSGINLGAGAEVPRSLTARANGLHLGYYYVIIRTDVLNGIYENNEVNNISETNEPVFANVRELPIGVTLGDTLNDFENLYFRIPIAYSQNDETMLTTLKADSVSGSNEMYLKYDDMPTRIIYDYSSDNPYQGNQKIIVPSVMDGSYYMLLYGNTLAGNSQLVDVRADILTFQILSSNPATGGNTGQVTLEIIGSKFDPYLDARLENGTITITAEDIIYVDYSRIYATFDLTGIQPGVFDLVLEKLNGDTVSLQEGFEVVSGAAPNLGVYIISPPSARSNRITSFTIEYANLGNTNIINPEVKVKSLSISPIALSVDQLTNMYHELVVPLEEENGPSGILRPGVSGTITIYTKTIAGLGYIIEY